MFFEVGDKVAWTSQAAGQSRTKIGVVIEVVPRGHRPKLKGIGLRRNCESYLVKAHKEGETSERKYWPRVSKLQRA